MSSFFSKFYKNGISLIVPTQNAMKTIEMCLLSFYDFADEIIVVDNRSTDGTVEFLQEFCKNKKKIHFYNRPELPDLHHNRNAAFKYTNYRWIMRIDSDYVAYTNTELDIINLRKIILNTPITLWPKAFSVMNVTVFDSPFLTGAPKCDRGHKDAGKYIPETIAFMPARIIQRYPFMKFQRNGRWEGLRFQKFLKKMKVERPYWIHCEFKSNAIDHLLRSERTNWRELGDFETYPTLMSYVCEQMLIKYGTDDINKAAKSYMEENIYPYLIPYDQNKYYPYPTTLQQSIDQGKFYDYRS